MKGKTGSIFSAFLFIGTLWLLTACTTEFEEAPSETPSLKDYPDQESWASTITITRDGRKMAEIWAGYIALYNKKNQTVMKDSIHVDFYNSSGKHYSVLTAREGIVNNVTNDLVATGNVVVVSDSGIVLKTEELRWDQKLQKIISDQPVVFTTKTDTLIGDSFISDPDLKNYEIRNARGYSRRLVPLKK